MKREGLKGFRGDLAVIALPYDSSEYLRLARLVSGITTFLRQSAPIAIIAGTLAEYGAITSIYESALSGAELNYDVKYTTLLNPQSMEFSNGDTLVKEISWLLTAACGGVVFAPHAQISALVTGVPENRRFNRYPKINMNGAAVDDRGHLFQISDVVGVCIPDIEQNWK